MPKGSLFWKTSVSSCLRLGPHCLEMGQYFHFWSLDNKFENTDFHWLFFLRLRTRLTILSLYVRIQVSENPYSPIFYAVSGILTKTFRHELFHSIFQFLPQKRLLQHLWRHYIDMERLFLIHFFHSALSESVIKPEVQGVRKWNIGVKRVKRQLKHFWEALWRRMKRKIKPVLRKWFSFIPPKNVRQALVIPPVWKWNIVRRGLRWRFYI